MQPEDTAPPIDPPLRVVVTAASTAGGLERLAPGWRPGTRPRVGRCEFILNPQGVVEADYWIVFANARDCDRIHCAPENTLLVLGEPAEKKVYPKAYYRQFHRIIDTHTQSGHPRVVVHAPCLCWHVGLDHQTSCFTFGHEQLAAMPCPAEVRNQISVVCSDAACTDGQRERLHFLAALKQRLGDRLVHFGRGFQPIDDKLDAILGFRFHLVMENCRVPHYWTEKLADAYLGWSLPIYIGAPNIHDYFPAWAVEAIDIRCPDDAADKIAAMLAMPREQDELDAVALGRELILNRYNPWRAWARWAEQFNDTKAPARELTIRSHKAFRPFPRGLIHRLRNR
jgi:hypothetical protein